MLCGENKRRTMLLEHTTKYGTLETAMSTCIVSLSTTLRIDFGCAFHTSRNSTQSLARLH